MLDDSAIMEPNPSAQSLLDHTSGPSIVHPRFSHQRTQTIFSTLSTETTLRRHDLLQKRHPDSCDPLLSNQAVWKRLHSPSEIPRKPEPYSSDSSRTQAVSTVGALLRLRSFYIGRTLRALYCTPGSSGIKRRDLEKRQRCVRRRTSKH